MRGSKMNTGKRLIYYKKAVLWNVFMCLCMMGGAVLVPFLREGGQAIQPWYLVLAFLLSAGASVYAFLFETKAAEGFLFWMVPLVYWISTALLLLFDNPFSFPFWTFGGLLLLSAFKLRYGMLLNMFLLFIIGSMQPVLLSEVLILQVLCLLLFGFVMPYAKSWKDAVNVLISVAAVLVSARIICFFTMGREALTEDIFCVAVVYAIVVCATLLLAKVFQESSLLQEHNEGFDYLEELAAGAENQDAVAAEFMTFHEVAESVDYENNTALFLGEQESSGVELDAEHMAMLESLGEENSRLLTLFSQRFPKSFLHVRRVALFASEVAEQMGNVNALLVKCAGYYHEIGRLRGEKSLENTLTVAKEEGFPVVLQTVLGEHTVDGDKPTSKEAALLLLTDNVCAMCEHLRKTQKGRILIGKVIDKTLNLRLTKGDLSQSGLTAKDLSIIRNAMVDVIKEDMF